MEDPYVILGVDKDATRSEVQEIYKELLEKYNTSSLEDSETKNIYLENLSKVNVAYNYVMKDLTLREVREHIATDDFINAEAKLNLISDSNSPEWNYLNGILLLKKGWVDSGVNHIQKAINLNPYNNEYTITMKQLKEKINVTKNTPKQKNKNSLCANNNSNQKSGLC